MTEVLQKVEQQNNLRELKKIGTSLKYLRSTDDHNSKPYFHFAAASTWD